MKNFADIILMFARARTAQERIQALRESASFGRIPDGQRAELQNLLNEARMAKEPFQTLRPLVDPTQDNKDLLTLTAGEVPVLALEVNMEVEEWLAGWNAESALRANQVPPPGPLLLHGPTGCGKTTLARHLVHRLTGRMAAVMECHRVVESFMGRTGEHLMKAFEVCAKTSAYLVIEEIDGLSESRMISKDGAGLENSKIAIALMRLIESANFPIVVTTNRPEALDPALLRRFEFKMELQEPTLEAKREILKGILGDEPSEEVLRLGLVEAVPLARRKRRREFLNKFREEILTTDERG